MVDEGFWSFLDCIFGWFWWLSFVNIVNEIKNRLIKLNFIISVYFSYVILFLKVGGER